ncbi:MAG: hypothetical protein J1G02_04345 [Clostridiales bacterium]|nr:hypothetical protein [Clostridiales bacterium]
MKKTMLVLLSVLMVVSCVLAFTACEQNCDRLGHDYGEWSVKTAPTCTEKGENVRKCSRCGAEDKQEVAALGHDFGEPVVVPATCGVAGTSTKSCSRCEVKDVTNIPATENHTWVADTESTANKAPTCTEKGVKAEKCSVCNATRTTDIPATGEHSWVRDAEHDVAATCTSKGSEAYKCENCTETKSEETNMIAHSLGALVPAQAPTCEDDGTLAYKECSECHQKFDAEDNLLESIVDPATGHDYSVWDHDADQHWKKCANDETHIDESTRENHVYDQAGNTKCECGVFKPVAPDQPFTTEPFDGLIITADDNTMTYVEIMSDGTITVTVYDMTDESDEGTAIDLTYEIDEQGIITVKENGESVGTGSIVGRKLSISIEKYSFEMECDMYRFLLAGDEEGLMYVAEGTPMALILWMLSFNYVIEIDGEELSEDDILEWVMPANDVTVTLTEKPCDHSQAIRHIAKAPTCETEGNTAYWYCSKCETYFADVEGEMGDEIDAEDIVVSATGHDYEGQPYVSDGVGNHYQECKNNADHHSAEEACDMQYKSKTWSNHTYACSKCEYDIADVHDGSGDDGACSECGYLGVYFITSNTNSWAATTSDDEYIMSDDGDGFYTIEMDFAPGAEFKVKQNLAQWDEFIYGYSEVELEACEVEDLLSAGNDNNIVVNYKCTLAITLSLDDSIISIEADDIKTEVELDTRVFYVAGNGSETLKNASWENLTDSFKLAQQEEADENGYTVYSINLRLRPGDQFKFVQKAAESNEPDWADGKSMGYYQLTGSYVSNFTDAKDGNIGIKAGFDGDYVFTIRTKPGSALTGKVVEITSYTNIPALEVTEEMYIIGNLEASGNNNWSSNKSSMIPMTLEADGITWSVVVELTTADRFKVYNAIDNSYKPDGMGNDLSVSANGKYTISWKVGTNTVTITPYEDPADHECDNKCDECGKCLTSNCIHPDCDAKCPAGGNHYKCTNPCETCGKCLTESCEHPECAIKCEYKGNHDGDPCEEGHTWGDVYEYIPGTSTHKQTCTVCQKEELITNCEGTWSYEEDGHKRTCDKCHNPEVVAHTWKTTGGSYLAGQGKHSVSCTNTACSITDKQDCNNKDTGTCSVCRHVYKPANEWIIVGTVGGTNWVEQTTNTKFIFTYDHEKAIYTLRYEFKSLEAFQVKKNKSGDWSGQLGTSQLGSRVTYADGLTPVDGLFGGSGNITVKYDCTVVITLNSTATQMSIYVESYTAAEIKDYTYTFYIYAPTWTSAKIHMWGDFSTGGWGSTLMINAGNGWWKYTITSVGVDVANKGQSVIMYNANADNQRLEFGDSKQVKLKENMFFSYTKGLVQYDTIEETGAPTKPNDFAEASLSVVSIPVQVAVVPVKYELAA